MSANDAPVAQPTLANWAGIATLGLVWGSAFIAMTVALRDLPPLWVAAGRVGIGALVLGLIASRRPTSLPARREHVPYIVTIAVLGASLPFFLLAWGQQFIPSAFAGVSMASIALFVLPLAHLFVPGERMTWPKALGVAAGFAGVLVLIGERAVAGGGQLTGQLACVGAAACYAVSSIVTRRCPAIGPIRLATSQTTLAALILVPIALWREGLPPLPGPGPLLALLYLAAIPTAAANLLRVWIVRSAGPSFMSLVNYQVPVWSVILGIALLGEPAPAGLFAALALILGGIGITRLRR
jgi:drug/metabolite transporter (DMT)-like permease